MSRVKLHLALLLSLAGMALLNCTRVTGTSDETVVRSAKIYGPDNAPAQGVTVKLFEVDNATRLPDYQTTTDAEGSYSVSVPNGVYNMIAGKEDLAAFQDSVLFKEEYETLADDTLEQTGVISGTVIMEPLHDPRTAVVQVMGTDKYSNVNETGDFVILGLPQGEYVLRIESTLQNYTPTYTELSLEPSSADDTAFVTVSMVYAGVPVVKNIRLSYDTLMNVVTLSWDTLTYFLLDEFIVIRDRNGVPDSSSREYMETADCHLTDDVQSLVDQGVEKLTYRVVVRTKTLETGSIFESASVNLKKSLSVEYNEPGTCYLGEPFTLSGLVSGYTGSAVTYAWDIGATGTFTESSGPDTTITFKDSLLMDVPCIMKVTVDGTVTQTDTMYVTSNLKWEKLADPFPEYPSMYHVVGYDGKLYAFCFNAVNELEKRSVWTSDDAVTWTQLVEGGRITQYYSKPVVFNDAICVMDSTGHLLTSDDAVEWEMGETKVCSTWVVSGLSGVSSKDYAPALFTDGEKLFVQPHPQSGQDLLAVTTDLNTWDVSYKTVRTFITDFENFDGGVVTAGIERPDIVYWLGVEEGGVADFKRHPSVNAGSANSLNQYSFFCELFKGKLLYGCGEGSLYLYELDGFEGSSLELPEQTAGFTVVNFNDELYLISNRGVFKAKL